MMYREPVGINNEQDFYHKPYQAEEVHTLLMNASQFSPLSLLLSFSFILSRIPAHRIEPSTFRVAFSS